MSGPSDAAVLTVAEMARADTLAIASGISGSALMEAAGAAVAREVRRRWRRGPVTVLSGPGNNGGDGLVAARHLRDAGWPVRLALLGEISALRGDAATMAGRWEGEVNPITPAALDGAMVVIDALFGAGLARPIEGPARGVIDAINDRRLACVAVDLPSGVQGDSGQVMGAAPQSVCTVTFFRKKPAHLLLPGRILSGDVTVADIGIPPSVLETIQPSVHENQPQLWSRGLHWPRIEGHKYDRGHVLIAGGEVMTGAARLAARAARRTGAGLVTIACPSGTCAIYAGDQPGTITAAVDSDADFAALIADPRRNTLMIGPGHGVGDVTRRRVLAGLRAGKRCVLDADTLSSFASRPDQLFSGGAGLPCILTPHEGEFARLFPDLVQTSSKVERARSAARRAGMTVLLKGADTVVSAPDGRALINGNAPPSLATAGSGDVLAGIAASLLASGISPFQAAAAAVWIHGECGRIAGGGLIAEDLPEVIPIVLNSLRQNVDFIKCSI